MTAAIAGPPRPEPAAGRFPLIRLILLFSRSVSVRAQLGAALLSVTASLTEGIGLALLAPLVAMLGIAGSSGAAGRRIADWLAAVGLSLSLPLLVALFVGLVAGRAVLVRGRDVAITRLYLAFVDAMRWYLFDAIAGARWSVIAKERRPFLATTLTSDIERLGQGVNFLLQLPALLLTALVQIALAFWIAPLVTLIVLLCGGAIAFLVWTLRADSYRAGKQLIASLRETFHLTSEFFAGLKLAKSHNAELRHRRAFETVANRQHAQILAYMRRSADARMLFQVGSALALGLFVYLGAEVAGLAASELLVLVIIFARLMPLIGNVQNSLQSILQSLPVLEDILALVGRCEAGAETIASGETAPVLLRRELRFSQVQFRYSEQLQPALNGVDLIVPAGKVVAIVGASGAGKSTLADMAVGLITPDSGEVLIDGSPLRGAALMAWRRSLAYVLQDNFLFDDSVRANMLWARPDASEQDMRNVIALTGAEKLVASLPEGLDSIVGDRGARLSGGERQRLALACALLRRPTMLVLDEATNALDQESEQCMWDLVQRLRGSMTILVIAHRLRAIQDADTIVVLDEGRVVQSGRWDRLIAEEGCFARLARAGSAGGAV